MITQELRECIIACNNCALACNYCAISCLNEEDVAKLTSCIQLDLECAAMCRATAELASLRSDQIMSLCRLCAKICSACSDECEKHASMMEHCKECAEACKICASACEEISNLNN